MIEMIRRILEKEGETQENERKEIRKKLKISISMD